jgi:NAD+ synthase
MNRISDYKKLSTDIIDWMYDYTVTNSINAFVIGVSGGIDSAVSSILSAKTGLPVYALGMPIHQKEEHENLSNLHLEYLQKNFSNVIVQKYNLSEVFESFKNEIGEFSINSHALANTRSRLRMVTLYQIAASVGGIVVGTGNKVEDYGIGFYTKYGDGGVDIAPIADLYKTEVWQLGKSLGIDQRIIEAKPTDGLWDDGRTDEDQIGTSYEMLEWVMEKGINEDPMFLSEEQINAIQIYKKFNNQNKHKMISIPTFKL